MKHYLSPKIQVVEVRNAFALCDGSGPTPAPARGGVKISNMPNQSIAISWT